MAACRHLTKLVGVTNGGRDTNDGKMGHSSPRLSAAIMLFVSVDRTGSQGADMGIDLKVLASHFRERRGEFLATASLRFDRDQRLLAQFSADAEPCLVRPIPEGLDFAVMMPPLSQVVDPSWEEFSLPRRLMVLYQSPASRVGLADFNPSVGVGDCS